MTQIVFETADAVEWLNRCATSIGEHASELTELDAAIGDADHGANMDRGMRAVVDVIAAESFETLGDLFKKAGVTLVSKVGGASGPLYGTFFVRLGGATKEATALNASELADALDAGVQGIVARGRGSRGEKTMLDAWLPALDALRESPEDLLAGVNAASAAAIAGRDATVDMVALKGRASYLGERSVGHMDPGATSSALMLADLAAVLNEKAV